MNLDDASIQSPHPLRPAGQDELKMRNAAVLEAKTWLRTPFHDHGRIKGVGCDCITLLVEIYERAAILPHADIEYYSPEWHVHQSEEILVQAVQRYAKEVPGPPERIPKPADILVYKVGRTFSHGAIVIEWPTIIHAFPHLGVTWGDGVRDGPLVFRPTKFFSFWP